MVTKIVINLNKLLDRHIQANSVYMEQSDQYLLMLAILFSFIKALHVLSG